jgi:hypothetical protein
MIKRDFHTVVLWLTGENRTDKGSSQYRDSSKYVQGRNRSRFVGKGRVFRADLDNQSAFRRKGSISFSQSIIRFQIGMLWDASISALCAYPPVLLP